MKVYVLLRVDSHDRSEVVGIYTTAAQARERAQSEAGSTPLRWNRYGDSDFAQASPIYHDTGYGYSVSGYEVESA